MTASPARGVGFGLRPALSALLVYSALCGFAVTQPVLDLFGRSPDVFIFREARPATIVAFVVLVTVVPALVVWAVHVLVTLARPRLQAGLRSLLVGLLLGVLALVAVGATTELSGGGVMALAVAVGLLGAVAHARLPVVDQFLRFASPAPLFFALLFLVSSASGSLVFDAEVGVRGVGEVSNEVPVVVIVFDELPTASLLDADGRIDAERFPHLAALAADSTWYRNATSVSTHTWQAVPAILTGRYPSKDVAPLASEYPENLFTMLDGAMPLRVDEAITRLCPAEVCERQSKAALSRLLGDAADVWRQQASPTAEDADPLEFFSEQEAEPTNIDRKSAADVAFAESQSARVERFVDQLQPGPGLHYLHSMLPHQGFRFYPSGRRYEAPAFGRVDDVRTDDEWPALLTRQRHLLQVQYLDAQVGAITKGLRAKGMYDDALIVLTADHGISFRPGGHIRGFDSDPASATWPDVMWVPMLVHQPGQLAGRGAVSDADVRTIDVLPTVADALDVDLPWAVDGVSVLDEEAVARRRAAEPGKVVFQSQPTPSGARRGERFLVDAEDGLRSTLANAPPRTPGPRDLDLYQLGPGAGLVGTQVADHDVGPPADLAVELDHGRAWEDVDLEAELLPAVVSGRVLDGEEEMPEEVTLAVSLDGRIVGASDVFAQPGETDPAFALIVPEPLLADGDNDLQVFVLDRTGADVDLAPVSIRG